MGIRNSFGLAIDPVTQNLWETENGEGTYDEINMVYEKFNGGWALNIGPSYRSDSEISNNLDRINDSEFQDYSYSDPKFSWYDTVGPTAIAFPNFTSFEKYKDWLFVGNSNNGNIYKFQLDVERDDFIFYDTNLSKDLVLDLNDSSDEIIFANIPGIITDIKFNDDGMYIVNYSDGIIYRIYPKEFDSTKTLAIISEDKIDDKEKELIASLEGLDFFTLISQGKIIEASDSLYSFIERSYYAMLNYLFS
jgi:glucose/arabinose dehydrogenase